MLKFFKMKFEEIKQSTSGDQQAMLLANLMTQMEDHYSLSMNRERFERETDPSVRELYLVVSAARSL